MIVKPAVVCGTKTSAAAARSAPSQCLLHSPRDLDDCVLRSVRREISRTPAILRRLWPSAAAPLTKADLDRFRDRADRFIAELDEEFYLHYAGLKEKLELAPIYERYSELTKLEQAQALGRRRTETAGSASSGASPPRDI